MALATKNIVGQLASTDVMDVYTVPSGKQAVITLINLVNTHATDPVTVNVYLKKGSVAVKLWTSDFVMQAKERGHEPKKVALEAGDKVQLEASVSGVVDYVISGAEG